jgi:ferrochelatase
MSKQGVLLMNLGSPDSTAEEDVRIYLREFLMDPRVIDTPFPIRYAVVNWGILPKRPAESAHAYKTIWTKDGSPLISISRKQQAALQRRLGIPVELAMRYRLPRVRTALESLQKQGVTDVAFIPMFPHYAMSSYETAVLHVQQEAKKYTSSLTIKTQPPYADDPLFIDAMVAAAQPALSQPYDHVLFTFHGIPERHLRKSDTTGCHCLKVEDCCNKPSPAHATCYRAQCFATARAFVKKAGIPADKHSVSFQSRLGKDPWLKPYTDFELERLPKEGVRKMVVLSPAFTADCLETIEELGMRGRDSFMQSGGEEYRLASCVNDHPKFIEALETYAKRLLS